MTFSSLGRQPVERLALLAQQRVLEVALLAAGAADEHGAHALRLVHRARRRALGRFVVGMRVHGEEAQRRFGGRLGHDVTLSARCRSRPGRRRVGSSAMRSLATTVVAAASGVHRAAVVDRRRARCGALGACNDDGRDAASRRARPDRAACRRPLAVDRSPTLPAERRRSTTSSVRRRRPSPPADDAVGASDRWRTTAVTADGRRTLARTAPWADGGAASTPRFTCDGDNVSPALTWTPAPAGTVEIAITADRRRRAGLRPLGDRRHRPCRRRSARATCPQFAIQAINSQRRHRLHRPVPAGGRDAHLPLSPCSSSARRRGSSTGRAGDDLLAAIVRSKRFDSASVTAPIVAA